MVAYGIVHLTIAWLGIQLSLGDNSGAASRNGALHQLVQQPFGELVVWVVAVGMFLLVIWKLLEAFVDLTVEDGAKKVLKPAINVFKAIVYGTLGVAAVHVATGSKSKSSTTTTRPSSWTSRSDAGWWVSWDWRSSATAATWSTAAGPGSSSSTSIPRDAAATSAGSTSCSASSGTSPRGSRSG
jgi:hypothetical protein